MMKVNFKIFATVFSIMSAILLAHACGSGPAMVEEFSLKVYSPSYAAGFEILGAEGAESTILKIKNPWQGAENVETALFISRNGEKPPKGFNGEVIDGEATKIICMSSSHVAMLDVVGKIETVKGVSGINFITNEYVRSHKDEIYDIGYDGNLNHEFLLAADPDLVLLYGVNGMSGLEPKLKELSIPFLYVGEYVEEHPLAKAEWIVALAECTGTRESAVTEFENIAKQYDSVKNLAKQANEPKPKVMINTPYGETWFMPSNKSYMARLIADAGGEYVYDRNNTNKSLPIDIEEAVILADKSDLWLIFNSVTTIEEFRKLLPKFSDIRCVQNKKVYNCILRQTEGGGNDFWESGVVCPHIILRDLVKIFHPELVQDEFFYFKKLE